VSLGFSVEALLPKARGGGALRMGLVRLTEEQWLDPEPDLGARRATFAAHPESVIVQPGATAAEREIAAMLGVEGRLAEAARSVWEDLCLLTRSGDDEPYRLRGAAVAFPSDWNLFAKMGLPLADVHAPIHGYAEHLSDGVDRFLDGLKPGEIYGRSNWFVVASDALRYLPQDDASLRFAHVTAENAGETLFVRSERQTLRRLPRTGAILFTIGIYRAPLGALGSDAVQRIAAACDRLIAGEGERRGQPHYARALQGYAAGRAIHSQAVAA
jgi:dimethylamine monooxygenase subunit A